MGISQKILSLLRILDETGADIQACVDYINHMDETDPLFPPEEQIKNLEATEKVRKIMSSLVRAKLEPSRVLSDEIIEKVLGIFGDGDLDEYFTILELKGIPGIVKRWKRLRTLQVTLLPGERVTDYVRQGATCYLYGVYNATAILCRTGVEFALEEAFAARGGMRLDTLRRVDRRDYLKNLINFAKNTRILTPKLATLAHQIRKVGNEAVHESTCTEAAALQTMGYTREVLAHIYGHK